MARLAFEKLSLLGHGGWGSGGERRSVRRIHSCRSENIPEVRVSGRERRQNLDSQGCGGRERSLEAD